MTVTRGFLSDNTSGVHLNVIDAFEAGKDFISAGALALWKPVKSGMIKLRLLDEERL